MKILVNNTVLFIVFLMFIVFSAQAQISPGDLVQVHSHLEGLSNCIQCHELGQKVSSEKCLNCHIELNQRVKQQKGFHSSPAIKGKECTKCHSDHNGRNFQIIRFDKEAFNHQLTGFELKGAHVKKTCEACHKTDFISDAKIKAKKFTFLGLDTKCLSCHTDYHQQTLSENCLDCHTNDKFKSASKFDHQEASFKLVGKHQQVACALCHKVITKNGQKFQEFKGVLAANCTNCHKDVHNNKFGQNCTECHNNESFKVDFGTKGFDHNKTDFRLQGKHQQVNCKSCHKEKLTVQLKFSHCTDCHSDYHNNQFDKNGVSPGCSACHNENGFEEFNFTIEQHNASIFPLKGAHLATPCFDCHKKTERWEFRYIGKFCIDCHENIHENYISQKYFSKASCEGCHQMNNWREIKFDHKNTNFVLEGAHTKLSCRSCHFNNEKKGYAKQQFAELTNQCTQCHKDVHYNQFEHNGITKCINCHNVDSFKPATKFDHNTSRFVLDGKHKNLACDKCHPVKTDNGGTYVWYKIEKFKCENCHL
jgi:hypothetical protein